MKRSCGLLDFPLKTRITLDSEVNPVRKIEDNKKMGFFLVPLLQLKKFSLQNLFAFLISLSSFVTREL